MIENNRRTERLTPHNRPKILHDFDHLTPMAALRGTITFSLNFATRPVIPPFYFLGSSSSATPQAVHFLRSVRYRGRLGEHSGKGSRFRFPDGFSPHGGTSWYARDGSAPLTGQSPDEAVVHRRLLAVHMSRRSKRRRIQQESMAKRSCVCLFQST